MKRLSVAEEPGPAPTIEDAIAFARALGEEYSIPELAVALEAGKTAFDALEAHPQAGEIMGKLADFARPFALMAPALLSKLM